MGKNSGWYFAADRGGTFTDVLGVSPRGKLFTRKLLSESPAYDDALIAGIRQILQVETDEVFPAERVSLIRIGTTVATNALLERKGEPSALLITNGFRDLLEIGNQSRPQLFDLDIVKPEQLYSCVVEIDERIGADGSILKTLDEGEAIKALHTLKQQGFESLAIVSIHAWRNAEHEERLGTLAKEIGFRQISLSSQCMPVIKLVGRAQTTLVDAYLSPKLKEYVDKVRALTLGCRLEFMQSAGGLIDAELFRGKDAVLSGPAGGVVAVSDLALKHKSPCLIGFDMGGTSTDVCRFAGQYERVFEVETAGIPYQANMLQIETVAAGGGSILSFDGQRMLVGPDSAGADPGPTCYGRCGPLTITDANLLLGRLVPDEFPKQFGPNLDSGLDLAATRRSFQLLTKTINQATGQNLSAEQVALGFLRVANEQMAKPIKTLSISRGYDVRQHELCCFGGAGGLQACSMARILGIKRILLHPLSGVYSAWGILQADNLLEARASVLQPFNQQTFDALEEDFRKLFAPLVRQMREAGYKGELRIERTVSLRPKGSDGIIVVSAGSHARALEQFSEQHQRRFAYLPDLEQLEIVALQVEVRSPGPVLPDYQPNSVDISSPVESKRKVYLDDAWQEISCRHRNELEPGDLIHGPLLIVADHYTVLIESDFTARIDEAHILIIEQQEISGEQTLTPANGGAFPESQSDFPSDPVLLEVFNHLFMSIADQMGAALINTAHSVNMKERLDFSCALFNAEGDLVANAPHIPVHLGAMGEAVKALLLEKRDKLRYGQSWLSNHPGKGGSHLPDVTLINPVFISANSSAVDFFVATRGHHADIGGVTPGSMSPFSTRLEEEGIVFDNFLLLADGNFRKTELLRQLAGGPYPARNPEERIADIQAQLAANQMGVLLLRSLVKQYGVNLVKHYMSLIQKNAAHSIRRALEQFLQEGDFFESRFCDQLDDGSLIKLRVGVSKGGNPPFSHSISLDFSGSSQQLANSFNAPVAVVKAAIIYALRCLVNEDIPLNEGCMDPVEIILPDECLLNPSPEAAVVAGNVETSQRIVDVIFGALGVAAASQGTMNNVILGWSEGGNPGQYYETIGGGAGATEQANGASAVQVHMTNTRITDPEILEQRYPAVRLEEFSIRYGSGGRGKQSGGDGLIRQFRFLQPTSLSLLSQRRNCSPFGLKGGANGRAGNNWMIRGSKKRELDACGNFNLLAGDVLRIETPGGGGYGTDN